MKPTQRLVGVVALASLALGAIRADEAAVRHELDACLKRYDTLFKQSFELPVQSQEVSALISQQVATATQKAIGFPLQVKISYFTYVHSPTAARVLVHLADVQPAQKEAMEKQANQMVQGSPIEQALEVIAFDALKEGVLYLNERKAQAVLQKETPATADFSLAGANQELLPGLQLKETWFRFDRAAKAVTGIQFRFANGKSMMARVKYADAALPSGGTVPVPSQAELTQDALTSPQGGVTVPPKLMVQYGKCAFRPAAPAAKTAPAAPGAGPAKTGG
jgi:hypothetical protein